VIVYLPQNFDHIADAAQRVELLRTIALTVRDEWHAFAGPLFEGPTLTALRQQSAIDAELLEQEFQYASYGQRAGGRTIFIVEAEDQVIHTGRAIALQPSHATQYLRQPLTVFVENEHRDGRIYHRLLAVVRPDLFEHFSGATAPWKFGHSGGKSEMKNVASGLREKELRSNYPARAIFLFDSDSKFSGDPGEDTNRLVKHCQALGYTAIPLSKRAVESYLPDAVFTAMKSANKSLAEAVDFILSLSAVQRDHHPIKKPIKPSTVGAEKLLYQGLDKAKLLKVCIKTSVDFVAADSIELTASDLAERGIDSELRSIAAQIAKEL
jgi:hypothetical protein